MSDADHGLDAFAARRGEVAAAIAELGAVASALGARSLASRVDHDLVKKLEADRFHLVVVGEFNHGKTTFVNALLGAPILPVGVTPTTACIHHLAWASEPRANVALASGGSEPLAFEDVKRFTAGGDGGTDRVAYLEIGYPSELLKDVVLVDTPGVNDLSLQRADITYGYIPRSDAVLFLLDAGQILKESERVFLQEKLIAKARDKIVFVVNKVDIWSPDEREEALKYAREHLASIVRSPVVFPVSAQKALAGDREGSGLPELEAHLTRFLAEERGRILLDNALGEGLAAAAVLQKGVDAKRRGLDMSLAELERRIQFIEKDLEGTTTTIEQRRSAIREEVAAIKAWARRDLDRFCDDVVRQLPGIVDKQKGDEIKLHLGPFLEATFRDWAVRETREIADALETLAERTIALVRDDAREIGQKVGDAMGGEVRSPSIEVDTFAYDVGIFALFTMGGIGIVLGNLLLGGLLALAAPVLAVYVKDKVEVEVKKRALELAPAALREAATKVGPKLDAMIDDFAARLDAWVVTAGEELHREIIEVLEAARRERASSARSADEVRAACEEEARRLAGVREKLEAMRGALWTPANGAAEDVPPAATVPNAPGGVA
jgi:small GTP-binding protein